MQRLLSMLNVVGFAMMLFALTLLMPLGTAAYTGDGTFNTFALSFIVALVAGALVYLPTRAYQRELLARDGFLMVTLVWTILPLIATLPLVLYFYDAGSPVGFSLIYFETMSGLTTTGATALVGLEHLPPSLNAWRATLMWIGGMGILVLAVAVLPMLGVGGSQVVRAETPGPMKDEKLTPRIASTAKGLYAVYMGLSGLCLAAYLATGMSLPDAYIHMAATVSLGGFSSYDSSFAAFDSVAAECVAMVFMAVCALSFATHFKALQQRSTQAYWRCPEARYVLAILLCAGLIISAWLWWQDIYPDPRDALRYGMFNTISVATTTGFSNANYAQWPLVVPVVLILLSCFTASSGSTGSGIKLVRLLLLIKQTGVELRRALHPRLVAPIHLSRRAVDSRIVLGLLGFLMLYGASIATLSILLLLTGLDPSTAFSAAFASINNLGPGLGAVGPAGTYAALEGLALWLCTFGMLLGRLELITVLVLMTPSFWRH